MYSTAGFFVASVHVLTTRILLFPPLTPKYLLVTLATASTGLLGQLLWLVQVEKLSSVKHEFHFQRSGGHLGPLFPEQEEKLSKAFWERKFSIAQRSMVEAM